MLNRDDDLILRKKSKNAWGLSGVNQERNRLDGAFYNKKTYAIHTCGYLGRSGGLQEPVDQYRSSPVQAYQTGDFYTAIDGWSNSSGGAALRYDDTLWAWGDNGHGETGQNDTLGPKRFLVQIPGSWRQFSYGGDHVAAINTAGDLYVWGHNGSGQLGLNSTVPRSSPVQITGKWKKVICSSNHTVAVDVYDDLYVWGHNNYGQLGQNDTANRSTPTQIPGKWSTVFTVSSHSTFITTKNERSLYTMGYNGHGHLGLGDSIPRSSPNAALLSGWTALSCTNSKAAGVIKSGDEMPGSVWAWGHNPHGELGHWDTIPRSSPTMIMMNRSSATQIWFENYPWHSVHVGDYDIHYVDSAGGLWVSGYNYQGKWPTNDWNKYISPSMVNSIRFSSPVMIGTGFCVNRDNPEQSMFRQQNDSWTGLRENINRFDEPKGTV